MEGLSNGRSLALEAAIAKMAPGASRAAAIEAAVIRSAELMVQTPWRIRRGIDGLSWVATDETYPELLVRCRDRLAKMQALGEAGHWAFNADALVALRAAELALEALCTAAALTAEAA